jgi:hypothetical protein
MDHVWNILGLRSCATSTRSNVEKGGFTSTVCLTRKGIVLFDDRLTGRIQHSINKDNIEQGQIQVYCLSVIRTDTSIGRTS